MQKSCTVRPVLLTLFESVLVDRVLDFCSDMSTSRLRFKYALRLYKWNELSMRANAHAKSLLDKDMVSFWKGIRKENNSRMVSNRGHICIFSALTILDSALTS